MSAVEGRPTLRIDVRVGTPHVVQPKMAQSHANRGNIGEAIARRVR
jgi:hypothetical protein